MPRQNRRRPDAPAPPAAASLRRREQWRGETYVVASVPGHRAAKPYRCPGCDQQVGVGQPHVVVWPEFDTDAGDRRHWHTVCWDARDRRQPGR